MGARLWNWLVRNHAKLQIPLSYVAIRSITHVPATWWWWGDLIEGLIAAGILLAWQTPWPQPLAAMPSNLPPEAPALKGS